MRKNFASFAALAVKTFSSKPLESTAYETLSEPLLPFLKLDKIGLNING